jgi:hypothetical protein
MAKTTIIQASHANDQLERLHINKKNNTVFSLDIESFYPSVTYSLVRGDHDKLFLQEPSNERDTNDSRVPQANSLWHRRHSDHVQG